MCLCFLSQKFYDFLCVLNTTLQPTDDGKPVWIFPLLETYPKTIIELSLWDVSMYSKQFLVKEIARETWSSASERPKHQTFPEKGSTPQVLISEVRIIIS